ncbi:hypothetical protein N431DRAFT_443415 [Stipitochalara longipes BDJ]|nr:hypothetical protein N431DRAFT_443415 [Stipitochalara longipes BDJ]
MSKEAMEVALAAVDASSVLTSVSDLILTAIEYNPGLVEQLKSYRSEISKAKRVVDLIRNQKGLQTSGAVAGQNDLKEIVEKLRDARKRLIQQIRLASVGLAKNDGAITVDTKVVKSTDEAVQKVLGKELGLDITLFLATLKRNPDAKGKIRLTEKEYEKLTWHQIQTADPEAKTLSTEDKTRIICNCLARDQSIQILGPVGVDL